MPDWNRVHPEHVHAAIAECDSLGSREFMARYRFPRTKAYSLWQGGQEYDPLAILGVAYLHATGRTAMSDEFTGAGKDGAAKALEALGFDVVVDENELELATARAKAAPKPKARRIVEPPAPNICPNCFMAIPATGVCDNCG